MPSTFRHATASAARTLLFLAMSSTALGQALTYKGCYSSSEPMKNQGTYTYQTSGYCQTVCVGINQAALGLSDGNECWCGDALPPESAKVGDSECNVPCDGYDTDDCGGSGFWSVYTTGTESDVPVFSGGSSSSSSSSSGSSGSSGSSTVTSSPSAAPTTTSVTTTAAPSVVTKKEPGTTIIVTSHAPTSSSSASPNESGSSGHSVNTAGVAAGVVVAVVVVTGAIAGLILWLRYRKRQASEAEYKQSQVSDFIAGGSGGERKPPPTSYSSTSDSRLEPAFLNRRNSHGSIADNEDYSRKILRVANPDRSSVFPPPERTSVLPPPYPRN